MKRIISKILIAVMVFSVVIIPADISAAYTGYVKVDGSYYYYNEFGAKQRFEQTINGKPYYFYGNGKGAKKGWIKFKNGSKKYSLGGGRLATGYKKIGKNYYYFDPVTGTMQKYMQTVKKRPYYFNGKGKAAKKGWIKFKDGSKRYCLGKGKLAVGYKKIGKYYYYFEPATGKMQKYSIMIGAKPYYFTGKGRGASKGWINFKDGSKAYCYGKGKLAVGTVSISGNYYHFNSNGRYSPYYITNVPGKEIDEAVISGRRYKGFDQCAYNYKGYNDYLAWHGCATTTLTAVLNSYVPGCRSWTPYETITIAEKKTAGSKVVNANYSKAFKKQMPLTLYGVSKVMNKYGISNKYVPTFKDKSAKSDIITHLKSGKPVVFTVSQLNRNTGKKSSKWTGSYHTMLMVGIDRNNNVLIINPAGKSRFQTTPLDEMLSYMWSCTKKTKDFYWNGRATSGGYIKITE